MIDAEDQHSLEQGPSEMTIYSKTIWGCGNPNINR